MREFNKNKVSSCVKDYCECCNRNIKCDNSVELVNKHFILDETMYVGVDNKCKVTVVYNWKSDYREFKVDWRLRKFCVNQFEEIEVLKNIDREWESIKMNNDDINHCLGLINFYMRGLYRRLEMFSGLNGKKRYKSKIELEKIGNYLY